MPSIDSIVTRLLALHPKLIDLSLDRMLRLLAAIRHPERRLPPVIHVAGTNGKGSTIAFMRAILEAAGLRVHVYTSPHLVRFNERFRLGQVRDGVGEGTLVSDEELAGVFEECERANAGLPITVFEITTAAGLLLFARHPADVMLLEVGLGGRVYLVASVVLGAGFLLLARDVYRIREGRAGDAAARRLFGFSILYLFGLFAVLLAEHLWRHLVH